MDMNLPTIESFRFDTGSGQWTSILLIIGALLAFLIAWMIYRRGNPTYNKGTEQTKPFISGWKEGDKRHSHVPGENLYWGLFKAMEGYYESAREEHSGIINDYMAWYVLTAAILAVVIIIAGGI